MNWSISSDCAFTITKGSVPADYDAANLPWRTYSTQIILLVVSSIHIKPGCTSLYNWFDNMPAMKSFNGPGLVSATENGQCQKFDTIGRSQSIFGDFNRTRHLEYVGCFACGKYVHFRYKVIGDSGNRVLGHLSYFDFSGNVRGYAIFGNIKFEHMDDSRCS
ncbi:hypothetical protein GA0061078_1418 [Bifidobacterium bohemicum]|uniref:Uncharacterized protein n=1 Tax=Bifidobacterium bohemicum DSM 22767 TaxID=1437606 RepID=A0A086ZGV9_9BIFI|nr:hypothetical protein BBOH_0561 [Bifidobacterium bohemicum DSM 22767]SCC08761.1 hypothetical protein GA0061078_1418 [Bifidobacterium bohemicum]